MKLKMFALALAGAFFCALLPAMAADPARCFLGTGGSAVGQCYPVTVSVDPTTGNPAAGSGGTITPSAGSQEQDVVGSPTLSSTVGSTLDIPVNGQATVGLGISGLAASGATITYQQSINGSAFSGTNALNTGTGIPEATRTTDGNIRINAAGRSTIRLLVTTGGTGTITIKTVVSVRPFAFGLDAPLPPGSNQIGGVLVSGNTATAGNGTITTGGTAQNLFGGTTPTNGFAVYNPDAAEDCWLSDSGTAAPNGQGSIFLSHLGGYETPPNYKPVGAVSVVCATTGHAITARRW